MMNNIDEVCDELLAMYQECLRRDFTSIQLLKEANARRPMWKQLNNFQIPNSHDTIKKLNRIVFDRCQDRDVRKVNIFKSLLYFRWEKKMKKNQQQQTLARKSSALKKQKEKALCKFGMEAPSVKGPKICCSIMHQKQANSSEMDGSIMLQGDLMKVFKEGVGLLMNNLWARRFSISLCGSNPTPMLQYLADVIFFWFTQTIKPLSFDHIVRILKNEMYRLPYKTIHYDIAEEVAKKLMVMYEECLQGNFSSVDILREESLSLASSFEETKGE
jgi:hypothetical protein